MKMNRLLDLGLFWAFLLVMDLTHPTVGFTIKLSGASNGFGEMNPSDNPTKSPLSNGVEDSFPPPPGKPQPKNSELNEDEKLLNLFNPVMTDEQVDNYLIKYGYLHRSDNKSISDKDRKEAIKEFQVFAHLDVTGVADKKTREKMKLARCGEVDPHPNSKYANFEATASRKWSKSTLTYRIVEYSMKLPKSVVRENVKKSFKMWSDVSGLTFNEVISGDSDIKLRFTPRVHGDGAPFDGPDGVLAHAFYPESGEIHMEEAENWTVKSYEGINLLFVLVHEIGHALGLGHSDVTSAVMAPFYMGYDPDLKLDKDDAAGVQFLYGKPIVATTQPPTQPATTTQSSTTKPPTTQAPTTKTSTTQAPTTKAPTTQAPTTKAPTTQAPTTKASTTQAPTTKNSTTQVPTTKAPTTTEASTTKLSTTTRVPTTQAPTTTIFTTVSTTTEFPFGPDPTPPPRKFPCPFRFWAALTAGNRTYGFFRRRIYEINPDGKFRRSIPIRSVFRRGPRVVGAAAYNEFTGHTFLFVGRNVYRYTDHTLDRGFPKRIPYFIRSAFVVDGYLVAFSFSRIHYLNENTLEDDEDGPVDIQDEYPGLPKGIKATLSYDDGYVYVFYRNKTIRLDFYGGDMTEENCWSK